MEGRIHVYYPRRFLTLFEYYSPNVGRTKPSKNVLLFVGGMYDNYLSTSYVPELASMFQMNEWTVMHAQLSSAMTAWGIGSLDRDVEQISQAVKFVRSYVAREHNSDSSGSSLSEENVVVVLMGHSTGCQDLLHYLYTPTPSNKPPRALVQGVILQAPASDREGVLYTISKSPEAHAAYDDLLEQIKSIPKADRDDVILSMKQTKLLFGPTPISATRFLSLTSPDSPGRPGPDDLFSSDLLDERLNSTFGRVGASNSFRAAQRVTTVSHDLKQYTKPSMLILISGSDEYVPEHIDKKLLLRRWRRALESDGTALLDPDSGVIGGGTHDLSGVEAGQRAARESMKGRVLLYLERVSGKATEARQERLKLDEVGAVLSEVEASTSRQEGKL